MKSFAAMTCVTLATLAGGAASADTFHHIDQLAMQLQGQASHLVHELHVHYRNSPYYRHLDQDAHQMEELAKHIHDVVHHGRSLSHLRHDIEALDRLYHHMEGMVARMRGWDLRHIRQAMNRIGDTLHHLRDDVNELSRVHHRPVPGVHSVPGVRHEVQRVPPRRSVGFSGNGWSIRLGF